MSDNKFKFGTLLRRLQKEHEARLPRTLANQAQNFFLDSFDIQGWEEGNVQLWKEVLCHIPGTGPYIYIQKIKD